MCVGRVCCEVSNSGLSIASGALTTLQRGFIWKCPFFPVESLGQWDCNGSLSSCGSWERQKRHLELPRSLVYLLSLNLAAVVPGRGAHLISIVKDCIFESSGAFQHTHLVCVPGALQCALYSASLGSPLTHLQREDSNLVDSASSHTLVSKIKPCMSKYKQSVL